MLDGHGRIAKRILVCPVEHPSKGKGALLFALRRMLMAEVRDVSDDPCFMRALQPTSRRSFPDDVSTPFPLKPHLGIIVAPLGLFNVGIDVSSLAELHEGHLDGAGRHTLGRGSHQHLAPQAIIEERIPQLNCVNASGSGGLQAYMRSDRISAMILFNQQLPRDGRPRSSSPPTSSVAPAHLLCVPILPNKASACKRTIMDLTTSRSGLRMPLRTVKGALY